MGYKYIFELNSPLDEKSILLNREGYAVQIKVEPYTCLEVAKAYQKGMDDAWEAAKKINCYSCQ